MTVPILLFCVGLVLLIKGGDWFVDGATGIAHRFGLPELLGVALTALLHLWKHSTLISILGGTVGYMLLVQLVF